MAEEKRVQDTVKLFIAATDIYDNEDHCTISHPTCFAGKMSQMELTFTPRFEYEGRELGDYRQSFCATYS